MSLSQVCRECICVYLVFVTCLGCFPGLTTSFSAHQYPSLTGWFPLLMVACYNLGDFLGKGLPGWGASHLFSRGALTAIVGAHTCFVPLFVLALLNAPALADFAPPLLVFALGVSTGYIGCMCFVFAGEVKGSAEEKEIAGMATSFSLMMGLTSGSFVALALSAAIAK